MPLALSATGPNTSIEMVLPVRVNMPMPHMATPKAMKVGVGAGVDQGAGHDGRGDDQHGGHGAFIAHGQALDDVRGVARFARLRQALDRLELGAGVILGAFIQGHGQDDADQAGPGGPHVEAGDAEGGTSMGKPGGDVLGRGCPGKPAAACG